MKLLFSESKITLLNLISHFENHLLEIGKSSHQFQHANADHIMPWALLKPEFLIIWRMSFLEKGHLANRFSACKLNIVSNILKVKESPRLTFERTKSVSQPRFIDKYVMSWNKDLLSQVSWLVTFPLFNSCLYISKNDPWIVKNCALAKVQIKLLFAYHVITWSMSHVTRWVRYPHPKSPSP